MEQNKDSDPVIYFYEPRLRMSVGGRFLVRSVSWISYIIFAAIAVVALISPNPAMLSAGILLAFILLDRFLHRHCGDMRISELHKDGGIVDGKVNAAKLMRPSVLGVFTRMFDHGLLGKKEFSLLAADHLLILGNIDDGLRRLDVNPKEFRAKIKEFLAKPVSGGASLRAEYMKCAEALGIAAFHEALGAGHDYIELSDLFSVLAVAGSEEIKRIFQMFNIEAGDLERALIFSSYGELLRKIPNSIRGFSLEVNRHRRHRIMNRAWTSRPTPTLDRYAEDLTDAARDEGSGFLIGHEEEFTRLVETISRSMNPNALMVGDAGIGKEALVRHLAWALVHDEVPEALFDKRLVCLMVEEIAAGASQEELSIRLKKIVAEIEKAGNIILYIPNIYNLVHTSGTAYLSAADILMPVIFGNEFPIVGGTFPREYKEFIEPRSDFAGAFEVIRVEEISASDAEKILTYEGLIIESHHKVTVSFGAVKRAVALAKKYFHDKFLPGSAEELLRSAAIDAEKRGEKILTADRVTAIVEAKTKIPMHEASADEAEKLLHLEDVIHERMIDQEEAVSAVASALREYRSGLARKGGPMASFLFIGPTGVGKTQLAKILAGVEFGSEEMITRFDMTEYQDKESFIRFIGSPDGTTRGELTEAIREKPYSLVLLDEFEKAYPDILNLFLQVLDDGRLTDNLGRTVDFSNTIIIATSNAHSDIVNDSLNKGESIENIAGYLKKRLVDVFKPELINRFSKIIVFKELSPGDIEKIAAINLHELASTISEKGISLEFDPEALKLLAKLGYDPAFGARPLRRVIDDKIKSLLANAILEHRLQKGSKLKLVVSDSDKDGFAFAVV